MYGHQWNEHDLHFVSCPEFAFDSGRSSSSADTS